jgi:hypothetical protein
MVIAREELEHLQMVRLDKKQRTCLRAERKDHYVNELFKRKGWK